MYIQTDHFNSPIDYFYDLKLLKLGSGREGTCFKMNNRTYKIYNDSYIKLYHNREEELLKFKDINIDNIYFIKELIYFNKELVGTICDYAPGISCAHAKLHLSKIDKLTCGLTNLKKSILELSELGIHIDDPYLGNILYDNGTFNLIDMFSSYYSQDNITDIYQSNMQKIMSALYRNITNKYQSVDHFIYAFLNDINSPYKEYLVDPDLLLNPYETITGIKTVIEEYIGHEITTFSKSYKDLLKIKKKKY